MTTPSDIDIAQSATLQSISSIAAKIGLTTRNVEPYGHYKAKINPTDVFAKPAKAKRSKLILVTAINPTPAGEGKTTVTIGLADALNRIHQQQNSNELTMVALREPSLGPVFGIKGGLQVVVTHKYCRWKILICILRVTFMRLAPPTIC